MRFYKTRQTSTIIQLLDFNFWTSNFWQNLKNTEKFGLYGPFFDLWGRGAAIRTQNLKSRSTKVVCNECPQFFRPQLFLYFAYFDFAPPYHTMRVSCCWFFQTNFCWRFPNLSILQFSRLLTFLRCTKTHKHEILN
jgi:hypothetical protein